MRKTSSRQRVSWCFRVLWLLLGCVSTLIVATAPVSAQAGFDCSLVSQISEVECEALVALYASTGGQNWVPNRHWLDSLTPCDQWRGVTCSTDTTPRHVILISLPNNGLVGEIPPEIDNLTNLQALGLGGNQLSGLPPEIGNLENLETLFLYDNSLVSVPPEIGNLANLLHLSLSENLLSSVPPEIGNLSNLQEMSLHNNQLSSVPPEIGNLSNLQGLSLHGNQLSSVPPEIGNLTNLTSLSLHNNQLSTLPPEIGNLSSMVNLYLFDNQLNSLPPEIGNLTNLMRLDLDNNQLVNLPPEIGNLTNLTRLGLYNNQFGSLPPEIGNLTNMVSLLLNGNQLSNLPPEIGNLNDLGWLALDGNQLSSLPPEIGMLTTLVSLGLHNNQLTSLPPEIGDLTNLQRLSIHNNQLSSLPPQIGNLANLERLSLDGNGALTGPLPSSLPLLSELAYLSFTATNLCEPGDAAYQSWLAGIEELHSTGVVCTHVTHLLSLEGLHKRYWPIQTPDSPAGIVALRTTLRNVSSSPISNLYFYVDTLSGNSLLLNGDLGPGGVGTRLTVPPNALGPDGVLGPNETVFVVFQIGLHQVGPLTFIVHAYGVVPEGVSAAAETPLEILHFEVTAEEIEASRQDGGIYLPWLGD